MKKYFFLLPILITVLMVSGCGNKLTSSNELNQVTKEVKNTEEPNNLKNPEIPATSTEDLINETITLQVYFHNQIKANDPNVLDCGLVFPVTRIVPKTAGVAKAALEELFKGPNEAEKAQGYESIIQPGVILESIALKDGVITLDLNKSIHQGGSCGIMATGAELNKTLAQFPTISSIKTFVNGVDQTENDSNP